MWLLHIVFKSCLLVRFKHSSQKSSKYLDVPNTETDPDFNTEVSSTDVERMCYSFAAAQAKWRDHVGTEMQDST